MKRVLGALGLVFAAGTAGGCAPAEVAGDYTVSVTNRENDCMFDNWTEGDSASGIPVVVTQDDSQVFLDVEGGTGFFLDVVVGASTFAGEVSGSNVTAALIGDNSARQGDCSYTVTVDMDATVEGDVMQGELLYRPNTNDHPDCGILQTCRSRQVFNGTRPPS